MPSIANPPGRYPAADAHASRMSALALIFRIVRWTVYACVLILLILVLHKTAPPPVVATPEAAARAEQKVQEVQQAVSQGQPATLRMNETELNSYLASHLDLAGVSQSFPRSTQFLRMIPTQPQVWTSPHRKMSSRCGQT